MLNITEFYQHITLLPPPPPGNIERPPFQSCRRVAFLFLVLNVMIMLNITEFYQHITLSYQLPHSDRHVSLTMADKYYAHNDI